VTGTPAPVRRRPTARGMLVLGSGTGLFLLATQFASNAVFVLAFACIAAVALAPVHVWRAPGRVRLRLVPPVPVGAGQTLTCRFQTSGARPLTARLYVETPLGTTEPAPDGTGDLILRWPCAPRGLHQLGRPRLVATDPFGLMQSMRPLDAAEIGEVRELVVYPRPDWTRPARARPEASGAPRRAPEGEPAGLRAYQRGDARRDIDWRATARRGALIVREREAGMEAGARMFEWQAVTGAEAEAALARLAAGVLGAARDGAAPGLRLPGTEIAPGSGRAHVARLLRALAAHPRVGGPQP